MLRQDLTPRIDGPGAGSGSDKRVLALVKAFLKAGILSRETGSRETHTGTPQGGILSPLLSNIALSVLDDHFDRQWRGWSQRQRERRRGQGSGLEVRPLRRLMPNAA